LNIINMMGSEDALRTSHQTNNFDGEGKPFKLKFNAMKLTSTHFAPNQLFAWRRPTSLPPAAC
jgi:hypothetical protein